MNAATLRVKDNAIAPTLYMADDDCEIRSLLCDYLRKNGYRAGAVADGKAMWTALDFGRIDLIVDDDGERLKIRIRDAGPGIPEQELGKVFEPFYRLETSRSRESGGTGLGLSIARNLARLHGGDITLRNLPGGGLEADLTLPRGSFALPAHAANRKKGS